MRARGEATVRQDRKVAEPMHGMEAAAVPMEPNGRRDNSRNGEDEQSELTARAPVDFTEG